jgi:hypothetical protein
LKKKVKRVDFKHYLIKKLNIRKIINFSFFEDKLIFIMNEENLKEDDFKIDSGGG